jgi:hypothetical protein
MKFLEQGVAQEGRWRREMDDVTNRPEHVEDRILDRRLQSPIPDRFTLAPIALQCHSEYNETHGLFAICGWPIGHIAHMAAPDLQAPAPFWRKIRRP